MLRIEAEPAKGGLWIATVYYKNNLETKEFGGLSEEDALLTAEVWTRKNLKYNETLGAYDYENVGRPKNNR